MRVAEAVFIPAFKVSKAVIETIGKVRRNLTVDIQEQSVAAKSTGSFGKIMSISEPHIQ